MIILILVLAVVAVIVYLGIQNAKQDKADGVVATFAGLRLTPTELIEGYGKDAIRHPVAGLTARVEDSGALNRRITATRIVAIGVFALAAKKKQDDREVYLTIEGPTTGILKTVEMKKNKDAGTQARLFANRINLLGRQLAA